MTDHWYLIIVISPVILKFGNSLCSSYAEIVGFASFFCSSYCSLLFLQDICKM